MTVTSVSRETDKRTMTFIAEFDAPPERVWNLWEDPRLLERWWGPPHLPGDLRRPRSASGRPVELS